MVIKEGERLYTGQVSGICRNALIWFGADGRYVHRHGHLNQPGFLFGQYNL